MTLKERIQELCKIQGLSMNQLETELSFGKGYLSKLGTSTPNTTKIKQIANRLNVTVDFLLGNDTYIICKECGYSYNPLDDESFKNHCRVHENYLNSKISVLNYKTYEDMKAFSVSLLQFDKQRGVKPSIDEILNLFMCDVWDYFSKHEFEVLEDYDISDFIKDELINKKYYDDYYKEEYSELCMKYGVEFDEKGLKNADIARETGISNMTLSDWKKGKSTPKQDKLMKIADYFGVTMEYLMTGENSKHSDEDTLLDVRISEDFELKEAIKKYYALDSKKKKHVIELINLLSV